MIKIFPLYARILVVGLLFFAAPMLASAYFTTSQQAIDLGNGTGLFLIQYKFGHSDHTIDLPLFAERGDAAKNSVVSYEVYDGDNAVAPGTAVGIVLSDASLIETGFYRTPKGVSHSFTLVVFFRPDENISLGKYNLQVTHLPFVFDGAQQLQLNPSELQYYKTDRLKL